jgi:hypothetical protein
MEKILRYLSKQRPDCTGDAWTLILRTMEDMVLTREEVYTELMRAEGGMPCQDDQDPRARPPRPHISRHDGTRANIHQGRVDGMKLR